VVNPNHVHYCDYVCIRRGMYRHEYVADFEIVLNRIHGFTGRYFGHGGTNDHFIGIL